MAGPTLGIGHEHACAFAAGRLKCWGAVQSGQLPSYLKPVKPARSTAPVVSSISTEYIQPFAGSLTTQIHPLPGRSHKVVIVSRSRYADSAAARASAMACASDRHVFA